jgi:hypothetical protein
VVCRPIDGSDKDFRLDKFAKDEVGEYPAISGDYFSKTFNLTEGGV